MYTKIRIENPQMVSLYRKKMQQKNETNETVYLVLIIV